MIINEKVIISLSRRTFRMSYNILKGMRPLKFSNINNAFKHEKLIVRFIIKHNKFAKYKDKTSPDGPFDYYKTCYWCISWKHVDANRRVNFSENLNIISKKGLHHCLMFGTRYRLQWATIKNIANKWLKNNMD